MGYMVALRPIALLNREFALRMEIISGLMQRQVNA